MIILGIDPGFARVGVGVIEKYNSKLRCLFYDCLETKAGEDFSERLNFVHKEIKRIIKKYQPDAVAVEDLFFYKNVKTAIKVGEARGVILLTIIQEKLPLYEFTPLQIKQSIVGYGRAEKQQMQKMVQIILNLKDPIKSDDAADALAVAVCAVNSINFLNKVSKVK